SRARPCPATRAAAAQPWSGTRRPPQRRALPGSWGSGLPDVLDQRRVPGGRDVERLVAGDARELDGAQAAAVVLVVADDARLAAQRALDREVRHRLDEEQVLLVGLRGAREVARLLDHDLLRADALGELLGEPGARVDLVEAHVAERVAGDLAAGVLDLLDDLGDARTLGQEDVHVAH